MQLFVRSLTVADFSYLCPKRGMVGESWFVDITLSGDLDDQNMLFDFGEVKPHIKKLIDHYVDHRLLVPTACDSVCWQTQQDRAWVDFESHKGNIHLSCPVEAFAFIPEEEINQTSVADFLQQFLLSQLPKNIADLEVTLRAQNLQQPFYHYSHGLKKHQGNCQRIAHGHRSPIEVFLDGKISPKMNNYWAERWQDIYLGSQEDLSCLSELDLSEQANVRSDDYFGFSYNAPQGNFQLAIPKAMCEIIPHDTTVELLATHIAEQTAQMQPNHQVTIYAYEGIEKGAIAHAYCPKI